MAAARVKTKPATDTLLHRFAEMVTDESKRMTDAAASKS